jgi:hypothetical protein
MSEFRHFTVIA